MDTERLQKYISRCGYVSRRKAEELIVAGKVFVNGRFVTELGTKINPAVDRVKIDGQRIEPEALVYYVFNKPKGSITSVGDPQGRATVMDYLKDIKERIYPIGRLDYNTEGLLLLTNDGALAQALMHPSKGVNKTYEVKLKGRVADEHLESLSQGVELEDGMTAPADIMDFGFDSKQNVTTVEITIHEGRNRQVRRMFEHFHYSVYNLKRIAYGGITLAGLKRGAYRPLRDDEVRQLKGLVDLPVGKISRKNREQQREGARNARRGAFTGTGRRTSGSAGASRRRGSDARGASDFRRESDTRGNSSSRYSSDARRSSSTRGTADSRYGSDARRSSTRRSDMRGTSGNGGRGDAGKRGGRP